MYKIDYAKGYNCYKTHPEVKLPNGYTIRGGSCISPVFLDMDVYIGFLGNMRRRVSIFPWDRKFDISFCISDMGVPSNFLDFTKLLEWTIDRLSDGLSVHVGCVGGHGRTGMFLAAMVSLLGETDAINYVRENYCKKAVESEMQIKFLTDKFGVTSVLPIKKYSCSKNRSYTNQDTFPCIRGRSFFDV